MPRRRPSASRSRAGPLTWLGSKTTSGDVSSSPAASSLPSDPTRCRRPSSEGLDSWAPSGTEVGDPPWRRAAGSSGGDSRGHGGGSRVSSQTELVSDLGHVGGLGEKGPGGRGSESRRQWLLLLNLPTDVTRSIERVTCLVHRKLASGAWGTPRPEGAARRLALRAGAVVPGSRPKGRSGGGCSSSKEDVLLHWLSLRGCRALRAGPARGSSSSDVSWSENHQPGVCERSGRRGSDRVQVAAAPAARQDC